MYPIIFILYLLLVVFVFGTVAFATVRSRAGVFLFSIGAAYTVGCIMLVSNLV